MNKFHFWGIFVLLFALSDFPIAEAQLIKPKAQGTPSQGLTIDQAQKEDALSPKARVAVARFEDKSAKGSPEIGKGMSEMLSNALFSTKRFIVLEREGLVDVVLEQDLGASGRVRQDTAPAIGMLEGADLLISGTITEFLMEASGAAAETEGIFKLPKGLTRAIGDVLGGAKAGGGFKKAHVAMIVKVVDAKTGRRLASEQVEGTATDVEAMTGLWGGVLSGAFSGYSKTPMEKAIRVAIDESVKMVLAKTPLEYYRTPSPTSIQQPSAAAPPVQTSAVSPQATLPSGSPQTFYAPPPSGTAPSGQPPVPPPSSGTPQTFYSPPPSPSSPSGAPAGNLKIVYVKWPQVALREGPGTEHRTLVQVQKGTTLAVTEESGNWFKVKLEDGQEGWIGKATVAETP